ncbi:MAG: Adaptive-response sensory-kinase SasA [Desulfovibrio sp.]
MRFPLWQRIFVYTIALIIISQVLAFFLHNAVALGDLRRFFASTTTALLTEIQGEPLDAALTQARVFSVGKQQQLWLTNTDGSALPGQKFSRKDLEALGIRESWDEDGLTLVEVEKHPRFWIVAPIRLQEGEYTAYMAFGPPPGPLRHGFLFQLFAPVLLVSSALALWISWRVSRPLRKLRDEVREMSETGPENKVTAAGYDEIAEVGQAINTMADELARTLRGMRALIANISHELRSPLARANLALGILEESLPPEYVTFPEERNGSEDGEDETAANKRLSVKYLTALQEELTHMETLIGTTLLTQRLETQQESVSVGILDFSSLCEKAWNRYNPMFGRNNLAAAGSIEPGLKVSGNATLLAQLLANLLDNALKYTDTGGEVRFSLQQKHGKCLLHVENSHAKLNEATLDHIFDPFYRIDQATGTGVGLGLALVQKTVLLHGGEIMAVPTDIGLCICMQLPLATK